MTVCRWLAFTVAFLAAGLMPAGSATAPTPAARPPAAATNQAKPAAFSAAPVRPPRVELGHEVLARRGFDVLQGKRVGLLTNPSGINARGQRTVDVLHQTKNVNLVALFAPEHGLEGTVPAGKEFKNSVDARTGLKVYSLYGPGPVRKPTAAMLRELDVLVYDLQDTGCRAYTFISTMGLAMEACAEAGVEFVVLDRPNPLGGERVEGPITREGFRSFVSQWNTPYVYGMTSGELARMINGEKWIRQPCRLSVVPLHGWQRWMHWRDTGLPWVPTSPFIRTGDAPMYQVATGILGEIGGVSIGMGTATPFQCVGAPWLDALASCAWLKQQELPGVRFDPVTFRPAHGAFRQQTVFAFRIVFVDPPRAPLMALNYYAYEAIRRFGHRDLLAQATRQKKNFKRIDKLNGTDAVRRALAGGASARQIVNAWRADEEAFRLRRAKYLLY